LARPGHRCRTRRADAHRGGAPEPRPGPAHPDRGRRAARRSRLYEDEDHLYGRQPDVEAHLSQRRIPAGRYRPLVPPPAPSSRGVSQRRGMVGRDSTHGGTMALFSNGAPARPPADTAPITSRRGHFWVGAEPDPSTGVARGPMFVYWEAPVEVTKPYPIVLIHGGGGQGLDYLGTPDGRPGWSTLLVEQGWVVYVV